MGAVIRRVRKWRLLEMVALGAAFGLGSCALLSDESIETPPAAPTAEATPPDATPGPLPPRPTRKPALPAPAPSESTPAPNEPSEPVDPARVIGLDEAETSNWLGEPNQRTDAPPATIWRYRTRQCEIDVYFYLDMQNRIMRALHYEVRSNDIVERRPEQCFQQLVDERRRSGDSASYRPR
jgi:hypothetical protein